MADFGLGTNPSDFGQLANQYNIAGLDPQVQAEIAQMLQQMEQTKKLGALGVDFGVQSAAAAAPPTPRQTTFKTGPNGERTVTTTMTEDEAIAYQRAMEFQKQALGGFAQQANQIHMQQQQAQSQPWQQLGTALAANMANQPGMPGWVRGLGQTAAQMNPTVDQLRAQYLGTMGQGTQIAGQMVNQNIAQQRTNIELRKVVAEESTAEESRKAREAKAITDLENQKRDDFDKVVQNVSRDVRISRLMTPDQENAIRFAGKNLGRSQEAIDANVARLRADAMNAAERHRLELEETRKTQKIGIDASAAAQLRAAGYSADRQAKSDFVRAALPIYQAASFQNADIDKLENLNKIDQTIARFVPLQAKAGGSLKGKLAPLMAWMGDADSQRLITDEATIMVNSLASENISIARASDNDLKMIKATLSRAAIDPKVAFDIALRMQKLGDLVRLKTLREKYAGNVDQVLPSLPSQPLIDNAARPNWKQEFERNKARVAKPGTLQLSIVRFPELIAELGGSYGIPKGEGPIRVPKPGAKTEPNSETKPSESKRLNWKDFVE